MNRKVTRYTNVVFKRNFLPMLRDRRNRFLRCYPLYIYRGGLLCSYLLHIHRDRLLRSYPLYIHWGRNHSRFRYAHGGNNVCRTSLLGSEDTGPTSASSPDMHKCNVRKIMKIIHLNTKMKSGLLCSHFDLKHQEKKKTVTLI